MDDPAKEYEVTALGRTWRIVYDNGAFRRLEEQLGVSVWDLFEKVTGRSAESESGGGLVRLRKLSFSETTTLLWAGLLRHEPTVAMRMVDGIVDEIGYGATLDAIAPALVNARPFQAMMRRASDGTVSSQESDQTSTGD